ncbi:MAG TPA: translation initiation factor IF-3 [Candidatus Babeliales bacterium]|nr:translation initiation factor IF-3 [Candidatus Babeliales bacterium]
MKLNKYNNNKNNQQFHYINRQIRAAHVLCIDENNNNCGVVPFHKALELATKSGLDLVQIGGVSNGNPPTCKILNYGKFKYELQKKDKLAKKKQRESLIKVKEVKFRPSTDTNDLRIKAKQAQIFLDDGDKLKITIVFRGRELSYRELGEKTLNEFLSMLIGVQIDGQAVMFGKNMTVNVSKVKSNDTTLAAS